MAKQSAFSEKAGSFFKDCTACKREIWEPWAKVGKISVSTRDPEKKNGEKKAGEQGRGGWSRRIVKARPNDTSIKEVIADTPKLFWIF